MTRQRTGEGQAKIRVWKRVISGKLKGQREIKAELVKAYSGGNCEMIRNVLDELDAASASEGTNTP